MPAASLHQQIQDAVLARLEGYPGLADTGLTFAVKERSFDLSDVTFPCVLVVIEDGKEEMAAWSTAADEVVYPVSVLLLDRQDVLMDPTKSDQYRQWRHQAAAALRNKRLPGVPAVYHCDVKPGLVVDKESKEYQFFHSGFEARFHAIEPRDDTETN